MPLFLKLINYHFRLVCREPTEFIQPLLFFIIVTALFPLAISSDQQLLQRIGPGLIWIAALLAMLLALPQLYSEDFKDGCLEQQLLSPYSLHLFILARVLVHWVVTVIPLIIITPLLAVWLFIPSHTLMALLFGLLIGTPVFSVIGAIALALTLGLRQAGMLLALLVLPLIVPVLIFGAGAAIVASHGQSYSGQLAWLGAMLALALSLGPFAIAGALKVGVM